MAADQSKRSGGKPLNRFRRLVCRIDAVTGTKALFILTEENRVRKCARKIVDYSPFEYIILLTTIANCIVLSQYEYLPSGDRKALSIQLDSTEPFFLTVFVLEGVLKTVASGFILQPKSYLRNAWNWLDFINIVTGMLSASIPSFNQPALRSLRVLRMIKLVTGISSLQVVMKSIVRAMAPLMRIGLLILTAIVVFAIIGIELYNGVFHNACWNNATGAFDLVESSGIMACCLNEMPLLGGLKCPDGYICKGEWEGPQHGIQSFDNIVLSMLTVFNIITMNGWAIIMYQTDDALGRAFNWIYFVMIVVVGGLFMLNLVLGVLSGEFANNRERSENRRLFLKYRRQQAIERDFENYLNWIGTAEDIILSEERTTNEEKAKIKEARKALAHQKSKSTGSSLDQQRTCECCYRFWKHQKRLRVAVFRMLKSQAFFWTIIILVLLDTVLISSEHIGEPPWLTAILYHAEFIFLGLFVVEMLLKIYGMGYRNYFKSSFNKFDCMVILASLFEIIWQIFYPSNSFGFAVLRSMRLLRVFKVTRYWASLRNLILSLLNSMRSIVSLLFLLFVFIVIFSLLGMQLFGGQWNFDEGRPDAHYDSFTEALLTVFQILTGEDWNLIMYSAIRSQGGPNSFGLAFSLYFIVIIIFGSFTLLNVFIAIAVDNLAKAEELTAAETELQRKDSALPQTADVADENRVDENTANPLKQILGAADLPEVVICPPTPRSADISPVTDSKGTTDIFKESTAEAPTTNTYSDQTEKSDQNAALRLQETSKTGSSFDSSSADPVPGSLIYPKPISQYSSLFIFKPTNPIRRYAHFTVNLRCFDVFMMVMLLASTLSLAVEDPVQINSYRNAVLNYLDYVFTAVFTVELLLKIIDLGFLLHPGSYCRDLWNILDLAVVICALATLIFVDGSSAAKKNLGTIKSLRVLRVLRPLKSIRRIPKLKAVFDCLVSAVKNVLVIMIIYVLFQLIFAVIGVQLFKGTFNYCTDLSKETEYDCSGEFIDYSRKPPATVRRQWLLTPLHYDHVGAALLTLFTVQTRSGWTDLLRFSMESTFEGHGPKPGYNSNLAIFYIIYFIVFPFFFLNIFVALIVVTFQEQGESELRDSDLDKNQRNCLDFVINSKPLNYYAPGNKASLQYVLWTWFMSKPYDYVMMFIVVLSTIALMMKFYRQPRIYSIILFNLNIVFTSIFGIEAILKIFSFGILNYFRQPWNIFDFITVVGSVCDLLITSVNISFLRLFRAIRLVKLLRQSRSIRILLWTFAQSLKALPYVLLLIGMLFYIYAVIGMQLFGNIALNPYTDINRHSHFQNFLDALLVLFRCSTLDSWVGVMLSCLPDQPCDPRSYANDVSPPPTCGLSMAIAYFVSFVFLSAFLMLNLFIAVIMDNFEYLTRDSSILGPHHLEEFLQIWSNYDPSATGYIHFTEMYEMMKQLEPPVGFGRQCPNRLAYRKLIRMNMPVDEKGRVNFKTTLFALIRESLAIKVTRAEDMDRNDKELRKIVRRLWPLQTKKQMNFLIPSKEEVTYDKLTVGKIYAGMLLAENWRHYRLSRTQSSISVQIENEKESQSFLHRFLGTVNNYFPRRHSKVTTSDEEQLVAIDEDRAKKSGKRRASRNSVDKSFRRISQEFRRHGNKNSDFANADNNQIDGDKRKGSDEEWKHIKGALAGVAAMHIQTVAIRTPRKSNPSNSKTMETAHAATAAPSESNADWKSPQSDVEAIVRPPETKINGRNMGKVNDHDRDGYDNPEYTDSVDRGASQVSRTLANGDHNVYSKETSLNPLSSEDVQHSNYPRQVTSIPFRQLAQSQRPQNQRPHHAHDPRNAPMYAGHHNPSSAKMSDHITQAVISNVDMVRPQVIPRHDPQAERCSQCLKRRVHGRASNRLRIPVSLNRNAGGRGLPPKNLNFPQRRTPAIVKGVENDSAAVTPVEKSPQNQTKNSQTTRATQPGVLSVNEINVARSGDNDSAQNTDSTSTDNIRNVNIIGVSKPVKYGILADGRKTSNNFSDNESLQANVPDFHRPNIRRQKFGTKVQSDMPTVQDTEQSNSHEEEFNAEAVNYGKPKTNINDHTKTISPELTSKNENNHQIHEQLGNCVTPQNVYSINSSAKAAPSSSFLSGDEQNGELTLGKSEILSKNAVGVESAEGKPPTEISLEIQPSVDTTPGDKAELVEETPLFESFLAKASNFFGIKKEPVDIKTTENPENIKNAETDKGEGEGHRDSAEITASALTKQPYDNQEDAVVDMHRNNQAKSVDSETRETSQTEELIRADAEKGNAEAAKSEKDCIVS